MDNSITYRDDVRPTDSEAVRRIVESSGYFRPDEVDVAVELVDERLAHGLKSEYYFIFAERDGEVLGYTCHGPIGCSLHGYDLYWIAVREDCRGTGLGKDLLRRAEDAVYAMGGRRLYIETSCQEKYASTRGFYLKMGYIEEARLKEFYAPGDDKVIYSKALEPRS